MSEKTKPTITIKRRRADALALASLLYDIYKQGGRDKVANGQNHARHKKK